MARESTRAAAPGSGHSAERHRPRKDCGRGRAFGGRQALSRPARIGVSHLALWRGLRAFVPVVLLAAAALSLSFYSAAAFAQIKVSAARVWPAADYTRITLESPAAIQHKVFSL